MKKPYNGHESWAAWNVSLWISNDEGLYNFALDCLRSKDRNGKPRSKAAAARAMSRDLPARTPDGARYSIRSLTLALEGLE